MRGTGTVVDQGPAYVHQSLCRRPAHLQLAVRPFHEIGGGAIGNAPEAHKDASGAGGEERVWQADDAFAPDPAPQPRLAGREGDQLGVQTQAPSASAASG